MNGESSERNSDLYLAASYAKQCNIDIEPLKVLIGDVKNGDEFKHSEWKGLLEVQATNIEINYDKQAKNLGLIIGISEEMYFCSISKVSQVYVEYIDNKWVAWRESYVPNTNRRTSYKMIAHGNFELVMARTKNYLGYIKKNK